MASLQHLEQKHQSCSRITELRRFCHRLWIPTERLGQCFYLSLPTSSVWGPRLPLLWFPRSLLICSRPLCPLLRLIRAPLVLQSLCIQASMSPPTSKAQPLQHSAEKPFFFWLNLSQECAYVCESIGVGVCMIEVCGSFYLRELLKLVWQERPCYADHPVSVISNLCDSAEWK